MDAIQIFVRCVFVFDVIFLALVALAGVGWIQRQLRDGERFELPAPPAPPNPSGREEPSNGNV